MSCLLGLLRAIAPEIDARLAPQVRGLFGGFLSAYLPQVWVFETDDGTVSLTIDRAGHAAAVAGALPDPDVRVVTSHARLAAALAPRPEERPDKHQRRALRRLRGRD